MSDVLVGGASYVLGWSLREATGGAGAQVELYDGTSTDGMLAATITLAANESTRDLIPAPGLLFDVGLFVDVSGGEVAGSLWVLPATLYAEYALVQGAIPADAFTS